MFAPIPSAQVKMKPPLKIAKKFLEVTGKTYKDEEFFGWLAFAIDCIQENQKVIYDLLPEKQVLKNIEPCEITIDPSGMSSGTTVIKPYYEGVGVTFTPC